MEFGEELAEVLACEAPFKWMGDVPVIGLEIEQPLGNRRQRGNDLWSKYTALYRREVDFDLVKRTGVDRQMHRDQLGTGALQAQQRSSPLVGGAAVYDPEDPLGQALRGLTHDLFHQGVEGDNASGGVATAKLNLGAAQVPGG